MVTSSLTVSPHAKKTRLFYFDLLRVFACLSVIMIHVSAEYAVKEVGSIDFWIGNIFDSISRAGVPLFVMISGALMLDEEYHFTKEKWIQHIGKMLMFFIFWSFSYSLLYKVGIPLINHEKVDVLSIALAVLKGHYHLWFVPMIIGLYLIVPLLRLWVKQQNKKYVEYFLLLSLVFAFIIPQSIQLMVCIDSKFELLYGLIDNMYIKYTLGFTSYFVLGWYLHNCDLSYKKLLYILGLAGGCLTCLGTYAVFAYTSSKEVVFYNNFSVNVLLYSVAIFVLMKSVCENIHYSSSLFHKTISFISKCSLGVYAVHIAIISVVSHFLAQFSVLIAIPSIFIVCTALSVIASLIISKIPFFKKFV